MEDPFDDVEEPIRWGPEHGQALLDADAILERIVAFAGIFFDPSVYQAYLEDHDLETLLEEAQRFPARGGPIQAAQDQALLALEWAAATERELARGDAERAAAAIYAASVAQQDLILKLQALNPADQVKLDRMRELASAGGRSRAEKRRQSPAHRQAREEAADLWKRSPGQSRSQVASRIHDASWWHEIGEKPLSVRQLERVIADLKPK